MIALLTVCLFFEILVHVLNIALAKARAKTVFGHLKTELISLGMFPSNKGRLRMFINYIVARPTEVKKRLNSFANVVLFLL